MHAAKASTFLRRVLLVCLLTMGVRMAAVAYSSSHVEWLTLSASWLGVGWLTLAGCGMDQIVRARK